MSRLQEVWKRPTSGLSIITTPTDLQIHTRFGQSERICSALTTETCDVCKRDGCDQAILARTKQLPFILQGTWITKGFEFPELPLSLGRRMVFSFWCNHYISVSTDSHTAHFFWHFGSWTLRCFDWVSGCCFCTCAFSAPLTTSS